ncbi:ankyrin repeat [Fusarium longipes]|uniref:Ankyrin repeat n=1 Tax=Fusarium longipes TaxID=694270 RepID=A0A395SQS4_9HYPO|nr:ankyrin repeat [Fusarium longipes]
MSIPINIPKQPLYRRVSTSFPEDEGPYMKYTETFESGHVYRAVSSGSGRFVAVGPQCKLPFLSFSVEKDRISNEITIKIESRDLKKVICEILRYDIVPPLQLALSVSQVVNHYDDLRATLDDLENYDPDSDAYKEMSLLVDDILLERSLYDGYSMGRLRQQGITTHALLRDIHRRNMDIGISDLEECFQLGDTSQEMKNEYLDTQNALIDEIALTGHLELLSEFCEPLLRSNEIQVVYNPGLLSRILDRGFLDVYAYILDLIERTRSMERDIPDTDYSDITYDPLCVAIRLGHLSAVETLIREKIENKLDFFEGHIEDTPNSSDRVFTPLLAAILWQRVDIIRLLLREGPLYQDVVREGPLYHSELVRARNLAVEMGFEHILGVLEDLSKPQISAHEGMSAKYPVLNAPQFLPLRPSSSYRAPAFLSPSTNSNLSGISSALHGPWQDQRTQINCDHFTLCLTNPEIPTGTAPSPAGPEFYDSPQNLSVSQNISPAFSPVLPPQFDPRFPHTAQARFMADLYRWKVVALERKTDADMFDKLVCSIWNTDYLLSNVLPGSQDDLLRFGELAGDIVSTTRIRPPVSKPIGTRIRTIQRKMKGRHKSCHDVEKIVPPDPESATERRDSLPNTQVVDPKVVILLQSVALNVLFVTSSGRSYAPNDYIAIWTDTHAAIQDVEDSGSLQHLFREPASINRSTAIVEDYLSFGGSAYASYDSGLGLRDSFENPTSPWASALKGIDH